MPMHSVFILNEKGKVLFPKYFVHNPSLTLEQRSAYEKTLYLQTRTSWKNALSSIQVCMMPGGQYVIFRAFNDLILILCGTDECDELLLTEILEVVEQLIISACGNNKNKTTEAALLHGDSYGKFSVLLDQMMPLGIIEHMEVETIERLGKLKPMS